MIWIPDIFFCEANPKTVALVLGMCRKKMDAVKCQEQKEAQRKLAKEVRCLVGWVK